MIMQPNILLNQLVTIKVLVKQNMQPELSFLMQAAFTRLWINQTKPQYILGQWVGRLTQITQVRGSIKIIFFLSKS